MKTNNIKLTQDQEDAMLNISMDVQKPRPVENVVRVLNGYAGTGKTTIIPKIIQEHSDSFTNTLVLAPTNRAVSVLWNKMKRVQFKRQVFKSTFHAFVYGTPSKDGLYIPKKETASNVFIIVDESSMLTKQMHDDLFLRGINSYILFVGDDFQLEPVGEDPQLFKRYEVSYLNTVCRHDNGILDSATWLRSVKHPEIVTNDHVLRVPANKMMDYYIEDYQKGKESIYLVATNKKRVFLNKEIRDGLGFKGDITKEPLICINNNEVFSNGETFTMKNPVKKTDFEISVPGIMDILRGDIYIDGDKTIMYLDNYDKPSLYTQQLNKLPMVEKGNLFGWHNIEDGYFIKRDVIFATMGFAISTHKSQGGQWSNVFVDFDYCSPKWDPRRWLYTAVTRASEEVCICPSDNFKFV